MIQEGTVDGVRDYYHGLVPTVYVDAVVLRQLRITYSFLLTSTYSTNEQ
jgi:hypothetical protein